MMTRPLKIDVVELRPTAHLELTRRRIAERAEREAWILLLHQIAWLVVTITVVLSAWGGTTAAQAVATIGTIAGVSDAWRCYKQRQLARLYRSTLL